MKTIAIIGAGGNAREIAGLIRDLNGYKFLGFLADKQGKYDSPLLGSFDWLRDNPVDCLAMGIGSPAAKLAVRAKLLTDFPEIEWPILIHPTAYVGPTCKLGRGVIACVRATATEYVEVGDFSQLNFGCTVGHEAKIGIGCLINPGANISGGVEIGGGTMIGTGAQIIQYKHIGRCVTVGAGAVVIDDVPDNETVVGVPAHSITVSVPR